MHLFTEKKHTWKVGNPPPIDTPKWGYFAQGWKLERFGRRQIRRGGRRLATWVPPPPTGFKYLECQGQDYIHPMKGLNPSQIKSCTTQLAFPSASHGSLIWAGVAPNVDKKYSNRLSCTIAVVLNPEGFSPPANTGSVWWHFWSLPLDVGVGMLQESSEERPGMLLNTLQRTGQLPQQQTNLAPMQ